MSRDGTATSANADTGARFEFGANWTRFLSVVDDDRIHEAEASLQRMLDRRSLSGLRFLDIGSGSGLFSLAARRLGADVTSFDFDAESVACALELRRRYDYDDRSWRIGRGSVLDADYMESLGQYDVVYSWGVLHHTGDMWRALEQAGNAVAAGGTLFIALYNDQGRRSLWWRRVKRTYNALPSMLKRPYLLAFGATLELGAVVLAVIRFQPGRIVDRWTRYQNVRGMSRWHDIVDWIGGYPFEVARPDTVIDFCRARGFRLTRLTTCGTRMGCNEFVLTHGA